MHDTAASQTIPAAWTPAPREKSLLRKLRSVDWSTHYRRRLHPGTLWYRDVRRRSILRLPPLTGLRDDSCEVHLLTCRKEWLNAVWAIRAFYHFSGARFRLCIHEDGSLSPGMLSALREIFPDARIIPAPEAEREMKSLLAGFPHLMAERATNFVMIKVPDILAFASTGRIMILDSDILFFQPCPELLEAVSLPCHLFNRDVATAYTVTPGQALEWFGVRVPERVNSGLGLVWKDAYDLAELEQYLSRKETRGYRWRVEQTLHALVAGKRGYRHLPPAYDVSLARGLEGRVAKHYVGCIREDMYREGMRSLIRGGFAGS